MRRVWQFALAVVCVVGSQTGVRAWTLDDIKIHGNWWIIEVEIHYQDEQSHAVQKRVPLSVDPPETTTVTDERYESLPMFDPKPHPFGWGRGEPLVGLRAAGCTTRHALEPTSVVVRSAPGSEGMVFERGKDYDMDDICGAVGRVDKSRIGPKQPVFISYKYKKFRIDSVVLTKDNHLVLRKGTPHIATPHQPEIAEGETRIANIWLPGRPLEKLTADNLLPITETAYPEPAKTSPTVAERLLPKTIKKLQEGQPVKILAWGDSVTEGGWIPDSDRWQEQFVRRLQKRFPKAKIELIQQGWGGKNTELFLSAPAGHPHNYKEKILGAKPDLIISEFINDAPLTAEQVEERYSKLLADFKAIGAEWIIMTPHYCDPNGMGFGLRERDIDNDPRAYVKALRDFAPRHQVALAEGSLRYGRVWRQGIPYSTLLSNNVNHPDPRGMALFADALMELFP